MIPFLNRFHGHGSLKYVYKNGQAIRSRLFTVKCVENKHRKNIRLAVIVSKKVIKSAVRRNRIRRRVYEVLRLVSPQIVNVCDIVVIVTSPDVLIISHSELSQNIKQSLEQAGAIK